VTWSEAVTAWAAYSALLPRKEDWPGDSIRTVRSDLDRIRDKTGCRRRADLTRLALSAELV
jgi:hypothetical protein